MEHGVAGTDSDSGPWFDYPIGHLTVSVAFEPGAEEMVSVRVEGTGMQSEFSLGELADICRCYELRPRGA